MSNKTNVARKTVLTPVRNYDPNNMLFDITDQSFGNNNAVKYIRVNISTRNPDGTIGDLVVKTPELFSYGIQENTDMNSNVVNGYSMIVFMHERDGPTPEQTEWLDTHDRIVAHCKTFLVSGVNPENPTELVRTRIKKPKLDMGALGNFCNCMYRKVNPDGTIDTSRGPIFYPKLLITKKNIKNGDPPQILCRFVNQDKQPLDPFTILSRDKKGVPNRAVLAIKYDSIYIGGPNITLQIKVREGLIRVMEVGIPSLLISEDEDTGSIHGSDDERQLL